MNDARERVAQIAREPVDQELLAAVRFIVDDADGALLFARDFG